MALLFREVPGTATSLEEILPLLTFTSIHEQLDCIHILWEQIFQFENDRSRSSKTRGLRPFNFTSIFCHIEIHHCVGEGGIRPSSVIHLQQANNFKIYL
jgi:hypothetical protein